jgi:O-antigen ligase
MSRMGLAAVTVSLLILAIGFSVGKADRRFRYIAGASAALVLLGLVFFSAPGKLVERAGQEPLTADERVAIWKETLPMTADYRLFGSGLGTYVSVFQKYRASAPLFLVDFAHNDYLQLLAELGLIGFAITSGAGLLILLRTVSAIRGGATPEQRLLAAGCAAALAALLLDSFVDFDFYIPANAMLAAWIAGIGAAAGIGDAGEAERIRIRNRAA